MRHFALTLAVLVAAGCASPRPKFYPNDHYRDVGDPAAQKDADECLTKAKEYVKAHPEEVVAKKTSWGAAVGAVIGGAIGLVTGNIARSVEVGAAAGGANGAMNGAAAANTPDGLQRAFTNRCLADKGYEVIGWR